MSKLTAPSPLPWRVVRAPTGWCAIRSNGAGDVADLMGSDYDAANAARIVACVNACEGIDDPAAALAEVRAVLVEAGDGLLDPDGRNIDIIERIRALLALLGSKP